MNPENAEPPFPPGQERVFVVIPVYRVEAFIREVIAGIPPWVAGIVAVDCTQLFEPLNSAMSLITVRRTRRTN